MTRLRAWTAFLRRTIRARLTLSHLLLVVLAMGLSGFLLLSFLERYFLQATAHSLDAQARITAQVLIPGTMAATPPAEGQTPAYNTLQQNAIDNLSLQTQNVGPPSGDISPENLNYLSQASLQLSAQLDTRIRILDQTGTVLVDSEQTQQGQSLTDDSLVQRALDGDQSSRTERAGAPPRMEVALPVEVDDQLVGVVYLSQPLDEVTTVLRDLRALWLLSTAVTLLLSGVAGLVLARAIAQPVRRLTEAAGAVAAGELERQVPVESSDEVGQLSQAFNDMTAALRAARQSQIALVANVSHELRTPLTAVKGTVETLRDGAVDDPQVRDRFLETVETETDRLIRLVSDLLFLSRADAEALVLHRRPANVAALLQEAVEQMTAVADDHQVRLRVEAAPDLAHQAIDPDRIYQVLLNLLDNAIKYSHPEGSVTVAGTEGADGTIRIEVRDQGVGIPAPALSRIGERFYRVDKARARIEGGSGLGLSIAQALVKAHEGELGVESAKGVGTTVWFTLPPQRRNPISDNR